MSTFNGTLYLFIEDGQEINEWQPSLALIFIYFFTKATLMSNFIFFNFTGSDLFPVSDHCMLQYHFQKLPGVSGLEHRQGFSSVDTLITFGSQR